MSNLESIFIKGYKSIRASEIKLQPLNVFIGPNGAGKSNLISVFELLHQIIQLKLQLCVGKAGGANNLLYFGQKTTDAIEIELKFFTRKGNLRNGYYCRLVPTREDSLIFEAEECLIHDMARYPELQRNSLGSGQRETLLFETAEQNPYNNTIADYVIRAMRSWRVYHFHDTSETARVKSTGDIGDNEDLRDDASNLAAFLYRLQEQYPNHYKKIVNTIKLVAPFFDDFNLRPSRLNPEKIRLEWREKGSDTYFNAHALSDGTLRFICLATLLQIPEPPATILIDEPELGLHPYAITLLASLLRSAATHTQVIVSTQSVTLVNQLQPEDIIIVDREDRQSVFRRLNTNDLENWLEEYGVGDLWEKNLLGGRP
ncbi:MAG: AAA family ATPase [Anaerolineae bacterium]|nr:AAA family ATPase [Anaerolineae bacterium]